MARRSGSGGGVLLIIAAIVGYAACGGSDKATKKDAAPYTSRAITPTSAAHRESVAVETDRRAPVAQPAASTSWEYTPSTSSSSGSDKTVRVRGYYRKDGTYVPPHTRRAPRR